MNNGLTYRKAVISERRELEELQRRASLMWDEDREALLANPEVFNLPIEQITSGQTIVAERGGKVDGFAVVLPREDGGAELDGLFVEPEAWRCGIGRGLVEQSCEHALAHGATVLNVIGNKRAREFYLACGFRITGEVATRFSPGLLMEKDLTQGNPA